jgi:hypothetical protein
MRRAIILFTVSFLLLSGLAACLPSALPAPTLLPPPPTGSPTGAAPATASPAPSAPSATALAGSMTQTAPAAGAAPTISAPAMPVGTTDPISTTQVAGGLAVPWNEWPVYESALRPAAEIQPAGLLPISATLETMNQYHLDVSLPADLSRLDGQASISYTNRSTVTLNSVYLHLFPNLWGDGMTVSDVRVGGQAVPVSLESQASLLKISLPAPLAPRARLQLDMRFSDPIPAGQDMGNYGEFALKDNVLALAGFYPTLVVYDDQGWHLERPSLQGDVLYADASLYDVSLTAPADLTVVATGETRERRDNADGSATWRLTGGPMRDFNIAASADYRKFSRQVGDIVVNSYAVKQDAQGGQDALGWAAAALNTYQTAFGPYPYRELDVVETPTSAGGIEYPGMVVIAAGLYSDPKRRVNFEAATAHEVAHQYWYNVVGDDQLNNPWLDESMAQYSTGLYFGSQYGEASARAYVAQDFQGRWDRVKDISKPIGLPVDAYSGAEYSGIVYGRGPLFLLALEEQIGKDKMSALLQRYYREYAWRIATPAGFQKLAEEVSGQDLNALFSAWVYPPK